MGAMVLIVGSPMPAANADAPWVYLSAVAAFTVLVAVARVRRGASIRRALRMSPPGRFPVTVGSITFYGARNDFVERSLNEELLRSVDTRRRTPKASLCVAVHPPPGGSILTVCIAGKEDPALVQAARRAMAKLLPGRSVDILFLGHREAEQVRTACK